MPIPMFLEEIAKERNCSPELVRAIVSDCFSRLHEASFKQGIGTALAAAYFNLDNEAAWHFMGLLCQAAENEPGELSEHYQRLDSSLTRFSSVFEKWEVEREKDLRE